MMLHYMYEHYIDKFEWFLRADDDVFIKPDKLEKFLRRVDSTKAQFIGKYANFGFFSPHESRISRIIDLKVKQVGATTRSLAFCRLSSTRTSAWAAQGSS
jgi:Fringe-like